MSAVYLIAGLAAAFFGVVIVLSSAGLAAVLGGMLVIVGAVLVGAAGVMESVDGLRRQLKAKRDPALEE